MAKISIVTLDEAKKVLLKTLESSSKDGCYGGLMMKITPDDIVTIRMRYRMDQQHLAAIMNTDVGKVNAWETGVLKVSRTYRKVLKKLIKSM